MTEKIEIATVSSRGQICIPNDIREDMGLDEGSKVLFFFDRRFFDYEKSNSKKF